MKLCPVAIAVGCRKCPVFKLCLVKGLVGDGASSAPARASAPAVEVKPVVDVKPAVPRKPRASAAPRQPAKPRAAKAAVKRGGKSAATGSAAGVEP